LGLTQTREGTPAGPSLKLFPDGGPTTLQPATGDLEALVMAMDFERKGYQNYAAAAKAATDPAVQQVYGYLAAAEEKHYEFLEKHHKCLESNGGWAFFEMERPMFEG
jgi:hypothetical protein